MDDRLIGVDVGGTKVSVAVFADGELSEPHVEPTERSSPDALLDQLVRLISAAAGDDGHVAVGLGVPSVVDWETGRVPLEEYPAGSAGPAPEDSPGRDQAITRRPA